MRREASSINKRKVILFILVSSFFCSILVEIVGFNFKNIINPSYSETISNVEFTNFEQTNNGALKGIDNNAEIKLKFDKKLVKNVKFKINSIDGDSKSIKYQVIVNGKDFFNRFQSIYSRYFGLQQKSVTINYKTNEVLFQFSNVKDKTIRVENFVIANYFQFNAARFFIIFILIMFLWFIFFARKLKIKLEVFSMCVILGIGLLFSILTPPHHTWDEYAHFIKSYNVAQGTLFPTNELKRDYPVGFDKISHSSNLEYQSLEDFREVKKELGEVSLKNTEQKVYPTTASINLFVPYLFSGLGMKIAMILNLPILYYLIFGKIMNVIAYALLSYFAIKKSPIVKRLIAFFAMLPINVFLAASLSCDFLAIGCIFLALAYTFDIIVNKKKLRKLDIALLLTLYTFITFSKVSYAPMFLFMFLFRKEQFENMKQRKWYYLLVVFFCGTVAIGTYYYANQLGIVQWQKPGVDSNAQLLGILKNPLSYLKMLFNYLSNKSVDYLVNMFTFFAYMNYAAPITAIFTIGTIGFFAWFDLPNYPLGEYEGLSKMDKLILSTGSLGTLLLSLTALYMSFTPVGLDIVQGFQGRYLLPIVFPLLFVFRNKAVYSPYKEEYLERIAYIVILVITAPVLQMLITYFYNS
ncbi:DUF2142 domain-containing protein [Erwinia sp. CPCC 100877]|nr:DUF2142 domain-containing protein [Erwinia sp. CPCC 100877]